MTEPPRLLPATPPGNLSSGSAGLADLLSDMLRAVHLSGVVLFRAGTNVAQGNDTGLLSCHPSIGRKSETNNQLNSLAVFRAPSISLNGRRNDE